MGASIRAPITFSFFILAALMLLLAPAHPASADNSQWNVRTWQIPDGLAADTVSGIAQSTEGYLWVATYNSVERFDGVHFENYDLSRIPGAGSTKLAAWTLLAGKNGGVWVGMVAGQVAFLKPNSPAKLYTNLPNQRIDSMVEDPHGALWAAFHGGPICRIDGDKITSFGREQNLPNAPTSSLALDNRGRVWVARARNIGLFDKDLFVLKTEVSSSAQICRAGDGGIWIADGMRIFKYVDGVGLNQLGLITVHTAGRDQAIPFEDRTGTLWIGTGDNGLFRYTGSGFEQIPTPQAHVFCVADDAEGNLWMGTHSGLDRIQPRAIELEASEAGLPFGVLRSMCQDTHGRTWGVTQDGSIYLRDNNRWGPSSITLPDPAQCIAADPAGNLWIGARSGQIFEWNNFQLTPISTAPKSTHSIIAMISSRKGDIWYSGLNPDRVARIRNGLVTEAPLPPNSHITCLAEDANQNIWAGSSKGGLFEINPDNRVINHADLTADKSVRCLYGAPDNSMWIGFESYGIACIRDEQIHYVNTQQGLYEEMISQIIPDNRGWLWFGGDRGIFKVRFQDLEDQIAGKIPQVQSFHYGKGQDLPSLHARYGWGYSPSITLGNDGRLWMPMETALAIVHPERIRDHREPPAVYVERVITDEKVMARSATFFTGETTMRTGDLLQLPPDYDALRIEFTALGLSAPENMRFRYRLDGFDKNWLPDTDDRHATYPRLPAGDYSFHVIASNGDGVWNDVGANFDFTVTPFLTQTWWFRGTVAIIAATALLILVRYISFRRLRMRLRILEHQTAVARERTRIARDLHDDLGARLTNVIMLSERSLNNGSDPNHTQDFVRRIATAARGAIKSLDETVWAVNPRNDTLPHMINYIGQSSVEFLRAANIRCRVRLLDHSLDHAVSTETRHNVLLVVKEALNNIVQHSRATEVQLHVTQSEETVCLVIEDNGQGFQRDPDNAYADGLRNMRQRMEDIGGRFDITSIAGKGTRISLYFPWAKVTQ